MGTLRYPGAPDFTYDDQTLANLQQIVVIQQRMGQGFWLHRQGTDHAMKALGHDAIWISPDQPIYIEFDSLDAPAPQKNIVGQWETLLTVEGATGIVIHPPDAIMRILRDQWDRGGD